MLSSVCCTCSAVVVVVVVAKPVSSSLPVTKQLRYLYIVTDSLN